MPKDNTPAVYLRLDGGWAKRAGECSPPYVAAAYEYARENDMKVIPSCSCALVWSRRHPEYADITL